MRAMRFHRYGPPEVLQLDEVPVPEIGESEVLVRNHAAGVNRLDVEFRAGVYGGEPLADFYFGKFMELPFTLGVEPAGEIADKGAAVPEAVSIGDRVTMHTHEFCGMCEHCKAGWDNSCPHIRVFGVQTPGEGAYAEYFKCDYRRLIPLPEGVSYEQAAALQANYGPALSGALRAGISPGEDVLVVGASGGVGVAAVQIAKLYGARVIATAGNREKAKRLEDELGVDHVVNYREVQLSEAVMDITGGRGADVVYELVGAPTWSQSVTSAGIRGRVLVIGSHGGIHGETNLGELFGKQLAIHGITRANRRNMDRLYDLCSQGKVAPIVTTFPLEGAADAHRLMEGGEQFGKLVLTM